MLCGVDAGTTTPSPAFTVSGLRRSSISAVACASTSSAQCSRLTGRVVPTYTVPPPAGTSSTTHASVLPKGHPRWLDGEAAVGVEVHRQPFPGVEQLDEQRRRRTPAGDVGGAEPALGVGSDEVAQQSGGTEIGEPGTVGAPAGDGRGEPLLGTERPGVAAQLGDPFAAAVEVLDHVRRQSVRYVSVFIAHSRGGSRVR